MSDLPRGYTDVAIELRDRILALIPEHPEILTMNSAWDLHKVEGFKCDDIGPSMAQAMYALASAKHEWKARIEQVTT
jgi:hypothetical protein